jgi:Cys-tRNA(Pro)/Cys-tRNA(Cys) deacylase
LPESPRKPTDAERITGYKTGGISRFGQTRKTPAVIEEHALAHNLVYVNGGQGGLQVRLQVSDLVSALNAIVAPVVA